MLSSKIDSRMNDASIGLTDSANFHHWITETIPIADADAGGRINNTALAAYVKIQSGGAVAYNYVRPCA